jgi:integrase
MEDLEEFNLYLIKRNLKTSTRRLYLRNIKIIKKNVKCFTKQALQEYFIGLKEKERKSTYINRLIDIIRLWGFCFGDDFSFPHFPEEVFVKATLSDEEVESFLNLPPVEIEQWNRWRTARIKRCPTRRNYEKWTCFFSIMAFTGMRPGEVASLTVDDIDWGRGVFILDETKTNDFRYVPIPPNIAETIRKHITTLKDKELFPGVDNVDWHYNFKMRIKRLGIVRKNLSPYSLRHSFITRLLEEDVNLFKVQKIVGHRQIDTTAQYTHMTTRDTIEAVKKHPLIRKNTNPQDKLKAIIETIKGFCLHEDSAFAYSLEESETGINFSVKIKQD